MTVDGIVATTVQFIGWSETQLLQFQKAAAASLKQFTDYVYSIEHAIGFWAEQLGPWLLKMLQDLWDTWIKAGLTACRDGLKVWNDFSGVVFTPLQTALHTFLTVGTSGLLDLANGQISALDIVRGAMLNARSVAIPWVAQLDAQVHGGETSSFDAHEKARAKLNSLVGWLNYFFLPDGTLRDVPIMESLMKHSPAAVSVLLGTGRTGDEPQQWDQLAQQFPVRDVGQTPALLDSYVKAPNADLDAALARFTELTAPS